MLSGGRLRLGIGMGWNAVEFEALDETFENRGRRSAEQIAVLRALWTQPVVDFRGEYHRISHAGLNPMPIQRPIPIWFGVGSREQPVPPEAALRRIARLDAGQEAVEVVPCDVEGLLRGIANDFEPIAAQKQQTIETKVSARSCHAADRRRQAA